MQNCWKLLKTVENGLKWLKQLKMVEYGWKQLKMLENGWKLFENGKKNTVENGCKRLKTVENHSQEKKKKTASDGTTHGKKRPPTNIGT